MLQSVKAQIVKKIWSQILAEYNDYRTVISGSCSETLHNTKALYSGTHERLRPQLWLQLFGTAFWKLYLYAAGFLHLNVVRLQFVLISGNS